MSNRRRATGAATGSRRRSPTQRLLGLLRAGRDGEAPANPEAVAAVGVAAELAAAALRGDDRGLAVLWWGTDREVLVAGLLALIAELGARPAMTDADLFGYLHDVVEFAALGGDVDAWQSAAR